MTKLRVLRAILRRRGYLVLAQGRWHPTFSVGQLVPLAGEGFNLGKPLLVIGKSSARDFLTQQQLSRRLEPAHWKGWSATSQLREMKKEAAPIAFWKAKPTRRKLRGEGHGKS